MATMLADKKINSNGKGFSSRKMGPINKPKTIKIKRKATGKRALLNDTGLFSVDLFKTDC